MNSFVPFSKKQLAVLTWWCDTSPMKNKNGVICDGAVRSGKTLCMSISFVSWAFYRFCNTSFALCGKTVTSLRRNVVTPLIRSLSELGFQCDFKISRNLLEIEKGGIKNDFYLFGGRDESSASLIQGMTLGGVLLDEVALMPRSFVEQALARCSLENSKFWFNCNPEHPLPDYLMNVCLKTKSGKISEALQKQVEELLGFTKLCSVDMLFEAAKERPFYAYAEAKILSGYDRKAIEKAVEDRITRFCSSEKIGENYSESAAAAACGGIEGLEYVGVSFGTDGSNSVSCGTKEYLKLKGVKVIVHE